MPTKSDRLYVRIAPETKKAMKKQARKEGRSLSNFIEQMWREYKGKTNS